MPKTPQMEKAMDHISRLMFGRDRSESIQKSICVMCGKPAVEFRDDLSKTEYSISGMCQTCQDGVFHDDNN
jgi:hypothetical protein